MLLLWIVSSLNPTQGKLGAAGEKQDWTRFARLNQLQLSCRHYSGCNSKSYTVSSSFEGSYKVHYVSSWDVKTLCKKGQLREAMHILDIMGQQGVKAHLDTYFCLLLGCINMKALTEGKLVHAHIIKSGFKQNIFLGNTLVNMYFKCGSVADAWQVFDKMPKRNVFTWTIMITGYVQHGEGEKAIQLFHQMKQEGIRPNEVTFVNILKACINISALEQGKQIHNDIIKGGFESHVFVGSTLVDMYAKCGSMQHARSVFEEMPERNVVSWNAMLAGYAQHGLGEEALRLFWQMELEGVKPTEVTFVSILKACAKIAALEQGKKIHACIIKNGFEANIIVGSTLVDMYAKSGSIQHARGVFENMPKKNVVSWTAMIMAYVQHGWNEEALQLFWRMKHEHATPNGHTFVSALKACTNKTTIEQIHADIIKCGFESDVFIGNTLVDMYAKCGSMKLARGVFNKMPKRDMVSWNVMIAGYVQVGCGKEALELFQQMESEGMEPDKVTFLNMLKACASVAALAEGKRVHSSIINSGFESDIFVGNTLIDMYAKCGNIEHALRVFNWMPKQDVVSWNTMVAGYAQHGHAKEALQLAQQMQQGGLTLDHITFLSVLSACNHAGLVEEGHYYFQSMSQEHGITPTDEHCACMVDLLGRAGYLEEAEDFIKSMPSQPSSVVWITLLGACRIYGNTELAKSASECILKLEPKNAAAVVLLSNIYAADSRWDDKVELRK